MDNFLFIAFFVMAALSWAASLYSGSHIHDAPARTAAAGLIEYHQAAVQAVTATPSITGSFSPPLPAWKPSGPYQSCADSTGAVVTYSTTDIFPSADRVAVQLAPLVLDAAGYGISAAGYVRQRTGAGIALPCTVPDGRAVAVTRTR